MDESRNAYSVLVGRPERKRLLGRPRRRWGDNIKMDLRKVGYDGRDWINLAQHRKLPSICSYWVEGKPGKNLNQVTCPDRDSNPGHLVSRPDALTVTPQITSRRQDRDTSLKTKNSRELLPESQVCNDVDTLLKVRFGDSWEELDDVGFYVSASALIQDLLLKIMNMVNIFMKNQVLKDSERLKVRHGIDHDWKRFNTGEGSKTGSQAIRENTGILLEASKEIGLEVNPENTKYMIMFRDENIVRNGNIKIGNLSFEEVEKFKYLRATVTNINDTRKEIKHRINMGNACYYSVEKLLSSSLLSKNLKVRIYRTVILPVVLYGCETWTLTLREEHRLRVFENKVLRKIFGAKRDEDTGEWRKLHNTELHALYSSPDIIKIQTFEMGRACSTYGRIQKCI
ncbi:hypothetical protein ANN_07034 [Periplaneta americana]|uniref:Reverse transcriptase domain-containing protein n=1 Tax=Periplaneta americana TaxID=6978 RepID=A0ABQ8TH77_PERAM|nr:hypothetical protein ANN_07034 [Periplaneta americana]